ncbi:hypothetical protein Tco_0409623 [Tanacetum coccineum]
MSQTTRQIKRGRDIKIPQSSGPPKKVGDEAVHKELGDRMERATTTASSKTLVTSIVPNPWQHLMSQVLRELVQSNDPPLSRVNTLGSGEDSMKLIDLMEHCTKLSELVRKRNERYSELKNRKRDYENPNLWWQCLLEQN